MVTAAVDKAAINGVCDSRLQRVREAFAENFGRCGEVGATVAVTVAGKLVVDLWAGHADAARTRPWTRDTIVNVASATKGLTAICAHRLVDRGLLDPEAPVATYWPDFAQAGKAALPVHLLLSHRAGLPAIQAPLPTAALYDWATMTSALAAQAPWWEPGTRPWRAAEIPAGNAHTTARALARVYGALACGGQVDGVQVLSSDSILRARTEQANGPDAVLFGWPTRFGLGFALPPEGTGFGSA